MFEWQITTEGVYCWSISLTVVRRFYQEVRQAPTSFSRAAGCNTHRLEVEMYNATCWHAHSQHLRSYESKRLRHTIFTCTSVSSESLLRRFCACLRMMACTAAAVFICAVRQYSPQKLLPALSCTRACDPKNLPSECCLMKMAMALCRLVGYPTHCNCMLPQITPVVCHEQYAGQGRQRQHVILSRGCTQARLAPRVSKMRFRSSHRKQ